MHFLFNILYKRGRSDIEEQVKILLHLSTAGFTEFIIYHTAFVEENLIPVLYINATDAPCYPKGAVSQPFFHWLMDLGFFLFFFLWGSL